MFHHLGLSVCDIERATSFLQHTFSFVGFSIGPHSLGAPKSTLLLYAPNCAIELTEYVGASSATPHDRPVNEAGITHFCIQSRYIGTLYEQLISMGGRPNTAPIMLPTGNQYLYIRDPESNVIEVEGLAYAPAEQQPWVAHVAIATPNIERLAGFYHGLLGGERRGGQKIGPNPLYDQITGLQDVEVIPTWIVGRNITLELWQYLNPPTLPLAEPRAFTEPGYNHVCFEVDSIDEAIEYITQSGGQLIKAVNKHDDIAVALLCDPDGNLLELAEIPAGHGLSVSTMSDPGIVQRVEALRPL